MALTSSLTRLCTATDTVLVIVVLVLFGQVDAAEYQKRVAVQQPTRLDWTFAAGPTSLADPPPKLVKHVYDSTKQTYEFYGPSLGSNEVSSNPSSGRGYPLILFLSDRGRAMGWKHWQTFCRQNGFLFAGPHGTIKADLTSLRIRIVVDVLDDVRRRFPVDPDRTYLVGFYRNAAIGSRIAYRLPEYFGGMIAIAGGAPPPDEVLLQRNLANRLSVIHLVGERDNPGVGNQVVGPVRAIYHPKIANLQTRANLLGYAGRVHLMPPQNLLRNAIRWLEKDVGRRRSNAEQIPSSRIADAPTREEHANRVLQDAMKMLDEPNTQTAAMNMLEGIQLRWPDVEAAGKAKSAFDSFEDPRGKWKEHKEQQQAAELSRTIAGLRPQRAVDPVRKATELPVRYRTMSRWIMPVHQDAQTAPPAYDDRTRTVITRLGSRVILDESQRVCSLNLSRTRVTTPQLRHLKQQLHGMTELQSLNLAHTVMPESTLRQIDDLVSIRALNLEGVPLTMEGISHLAGLPEIRFLSLAHTRATSNGIAQLACIPNLQVLHLGGSKVNNACIKLLEQAKLLEALVLAACRIDDDVAEDFGKLVSLRYLNLSACAVGDNTVRELARLPILEEINLNYTRVTDDGLAALTECRSVKHMSLVGTRVSDESIRKLGALPKLEMLNVRSTRVTDKGVQNLKQANPNVEILWEGNRVRTIDQQRTEIMNLRSLRTRSFNAQP